MIGMTRSSSLPSLYDEKEFLELVWENGQILERGGSSSNTTHHQNVSITGSEGRRTSLGRVNSLSDEFPPHHRESDLMMMNSSHQSSDQHSCQIDDLQFPQISKNSSILQEQVANTSRLPSSAKESKINGNHNQLLCTYLTPSQQWLPTSSPLKKPRVDYYSNQAPASASTKKSDTQYLGCDINQRTTRKVNFSNFLIPALHLRSSHRQETTANQPVGNNNNASCSARVEEINESSKVGKRSPAATNGSRVPDVVSCNNNDGNLRIQGSHHVPQYYNKTSNSATPKGKGIANDNELRNEPLLGSSSVCSLEASNDPNICIRRHVHEYTTDDSTYLSDNDEETQDVVKETPPRDPNRVKRCRNAEIHNLSERKRRDNINKKIRTLKELIPNCDKMDKASTLDDAIDYLKTLKLQLQIMSMGSGFCNPLMMLPAMNASPHLPHQLMGAAGMCFRPAAGGTGFPCNPTTPQFPIPPLSPITDTTLLNMFGFSNHMRFMPTILPHHAPNFVPNINEIKSPTPPLRPPVTTPTNLVGNLAASSATLEDRHANAEYAAAAMQATNNQVSLHHNNTVYPFYFPTGKEGNMDVGQEGKTRIM